jgi:hypothetical protein
MNFSDVESLEEAEFVAPRPRLLTDDDRARHRQEKRRLAITERDERLMQREEHPGDVQDEEALYAAKRTVRRADHRWYREFAEQELENPNSPENFDSDDPMWNDLWTKTTSNNE